MKWKETRTPRLFQERRKGNRLQQNTSPCILSLSFEGVTATSVLVLSGLLTDSVYKSMGANMVMREVSSLAAPTTTTLSGEVT